ncbi:MAG: hypothetical protein AAF961_06935 [Planctomycetota bacterium]
MSFKVWNNPLVVSAMRLRYRRGSPRLMLSSYVAAMLGIGALLNHLSNLHGFPFASVYLLVLLSVQFLLSGGIALFGTAKSMHAEVANQTLDFQRIVSLSPRSILIGKMLGEPASSYLLAAATLPLAAFCWSKSGASGVVILLFYVNLATWTLMCASLGLLHPLTAPSGRTARQRGGAGLFIFLAVIFLPNFLVNGAAMLEVPGAGDAVQLLTPLGSLIRFYQGDAFAAQVTLWNFSVPSLIAAPLAQIGVVATIVAGMSQKLTNPIDPPLSKIRGYATLGVIDLVLAGICLSHVDRPHPAPHLFFCYFLSHFLACVALLFGMVPNRAALASWAWRHSARRPTVIEKMWGRRLEVGAAAIIFCTIGAAVFAGAFMIPAAVEQAAASAAQTEVGADASAPLGSAAILSAWLPEFAKVLAATAAFTLSAAMVQQLLAAAVSKSATALYVFYLFAINALPPIIASVLEAWWQNGGASFDAAPTLVSLSPIGYYVTNLSYVSGAYLDIAWPALLHLFLAALAGWRLHRLRRREHADVRRKLQQMGVGEQSVALASTGR